MTLIQRISDLTTRVATEFKNVKTIISGNAAGNLINLTTSSKVSVVGSINSLKEESDSKEPLIGYITENSANKAQAGGYAPLDAGSKVPAIHLPAYVDDVLEHDDFDSLPASGSTGILYVTLFDNLTYRWTGSVYVEISKSLALGETSSTAYRGDRGKIAYEHSLERDNNPHLTKFNQLEDKPTTISGFAITDAFTKTQIGEIDTDYVTSFESSLL